MIRDLESIEWWVLLLAFSEILMLIILIAWALVKAAAMPYPGLLVTSMSLLSLMLLVVYVITKQQEVVTLIGVPLGALATAMSSVFRPDPNLPPNVTKTTVTEPHTNGMVTTVTEAPVKPDEGA